MTHPEKSDDEKQNRRQRLERKRRSSAGYSGDNWGRSPRTTPYKRERVEYDPYEDDIDLEPYEED